MTTTLKDNPKSAIKPVGRLDASMLLARKGEAAPAVRATSQNNPELAWNLAGTGGNTHAPSVHVPKAHVPQADPRPANEQPTPALRPRHTTKPTASARLRPDSFQSVTTREQAATEGQAQKTGQSPVALTLRIDEDAYLRLAYLAQCAGYSLSRVLYDALDNHLLQCRVPKASKLTVRPK